MSFDDMLRECDEAFDVFVESQTVIYRPKGGRPRPIRAIIDRTPPAPAIPGQPKPEVYAMLLSVPNDPVRGIEHRTINTADRIDVPLRMGGPLVERGFSAELNEVDAGRLIVKVL